MTTLVDRFKAAYGKSHADYLGRYEGPFRLHDHVIDAVRACVHLLNHLDIETYGRRKADILVVATYLHDLGKLDENFQKMLKFRYDKQEGSLSQAGIKIVKHEASTFDFTGSITPTDIAAVCAMISEVTGYYPNPNTFDQTALDDVWGFAATHHGLFYVSYEIREGQDSPIPRIRRTWTTFNPGERSRLTFVDLLLRYHPLGGMITACDLIASASQNRSKAIDGLLNELATLESFIKHVLEHVEEIEQAIQKDDGKDYFLEGILKLLLGGMVDLPTAKGDFYETKLATTSLA